MLINIYALQIHLQKFTGLTVGTLEHRTPGENRLVPRGRDPRADWLRAAHPHILVFQMEACLFKDKRLHSF